MLAILDAIKQQRLKVEATVVISNVESALGLSKARDFGVESLFISHKNRTREEHDSEILHELRRREVTLVCLAGYMRLISEQFVREFPDRILNVHPSLLPAFPGLNAQRQALEHGVKVTGCTVHLVDEHLDHGPIVLQRTVEVREDDSIDTLSARFLGEVHGFSPLVISRLVSP